MGSGSQRCVTLSHSAQVKRFTAEVLRILKVQASRQISILEFPLVYGRFPNIVCNRYWLKMVCTNTSCLFSVVLVHK